MGCIDNGEQVVVMWFSAARLAPENWSSSTSAALSFLDDSREMTRW